MVTTDNPNISYSGFTTSTSCTVSSSMGGNVGCNVGAGYGGSVFFEGELPRNSVPIGFLNNLRFEIDEWLKGALD